MMDQAKRLMDQAKQVHLEKQLSFRGAEECQKCKDQQNDSMPESIHQDHAGQEVIQSLKSQIQGLKYDNDEIRPRLQMQEARLTVERERNDDLNQRTDQLKACFENEKEVINLQLR